ncbi:MAG: 50S ribosomal protein L17 [Dehalococcoidia bacterium]|nr:50S ribosomal protein L17 [Dehalococcoidia bacterium]
MRHRVAGRHLNRPTDQRLALYRGLVRDLLLHERIQTTVAKAKEMRGMVDRVITYGKKGTLHHRRLALAYLPDKDVVAKVFSELAPRYAERPGGYTRVLKLAQRPGDGAPMALIELV